MSDAHGGAGWWVGADGRWYPPQAGGGSVPWGPSPGPPPLPQPPSDGGGGIHHPLLVGVALTCCFPIGLVLVWTSGYKLVTKWVLTGVVGVVFVSSMIAGALDPPEGREVDTAATSDEPDAREEPAPTTSTPEAPTAEAPTTTAEPTTTMAPIDEALIGRMAIALAMCDSYGGMDPGFFVDWCSIDPDGADLIELVDAACDSLDAVDPTHTASDEEITNAYVFSLGQLLLSGEVTEAEAESLAAMGGAVLSVRDAVC